MLATPKAKEGQLQSVRLGFREGGTLEVLEMEDSFGQRSVLSFGRLQINPALSANAFDFKVPPGADLIRQ